MKFADFIRMYDSKSDEQILLDIEGIKKVQEVSRSATPLLDGVGEMFVAYFWIDDRLLGVRLEYDERAF